MDESIISLLKTFIKKAISEEHIFFGLDKTNEAERTNSLICFSSQIFQFLDYVFTHFPTQENKEKRMYFLRPVYKDTKQNYFIELARYLKKYGTTSSPKLNSFLDKCFDIIAQNDYAICLLEWSSKHENPPNLKQEVILEGKYRSNYPDAITQEDWFVNIWGVIKAKNVKMKNCTVKNGDKLLIIDHLETTNIKGDDIVFNKNGLTIPFKDFAENCVQTCIDILEELKQIK